MKMYFICNFFLFFFFFSSLSSFFNIYKCVYIFICMYV